MLTFHESFECFVLGEQGLGQECPKCFWSLRDSSWPTSTEYSGPFGTNSGPKSPKKWFRLEQKNIIYITNPSLYALMLAIMVRDNSLKGIEL